MCVLSCFGHVRLFVTPWTVARQASLSMGFSKQEYWSGLPSPPPRDLPHPGIKPASLMSPALAGRFFTLSITWEALSSYACVSISHSVVSNIPTTIYKIKGFPGGASGKDPACQWMGHGPWGCKESNTTEQLSLHFTLALSFLHSCFLFLFFLNSKHLPLFDKS